MSRNQVLKKHHVSGARKGDKVSADPRMRKQVLYRVLDLRSEDAPTDQTFLKKRLAKKAAKRIGLGSVMLKRVYFQPRDKTKNYQSEWLQGAISTQPAAPWLKNGKRMNYLSYWHNYTAKGYLTTTREEIVDYASKEDVK